MKIKLFTIPNCITLINLLCGIGAIVSSLVYNDLQLAFIFIIASAVADFCDGLTARLLKQYSAIGVQLDSLADMVSFGAAPAVAMTVICQAMPSAFGVSGVGLIFSAIFRLSLRLCRHSVLRSSISTRHRPRSSRVFQPLHRQSCSYRWRHCASATASS
jgi:phosphatidylserine synthase